MPLKTLKSPAKCRRRDLKDFKVPKVIKPVEEPPQEIGIAPYWAVPIRLLSDSSAGYFSSHLLPLSSRMVSRLRTWKSPRLSVNCME